MENTVTVSDSFDRPNTFFEVQRRFKSNKKHISNIANWIRKHHYEGCAGIIYCQSRQATVFIAQMLTSDHGIRAACFHDGIRKKQRKETQQAWQAGTIKVIVATVS